MKLPSLPTLDSIEQKKTIPFSGIVLLLFNFNAFCQINPRLISR